MSQFVMFYSNSIGSCERDYCHETYLDRPMYRGVETVGPLSPVGHLHLKSDSSTILSHQMSERTPKYLKCYLGDISAYIGPTVK